jgi:hypothetical protein
MMQTTIRFKRPYCGRAVGATDTLMGYGVHDALVQRGVAEFCSAAPVIAAGISEPQLSSETFGERKSRRQSKKETE